MAGSWARGQVSGRGFKASATSQEVRVGSAKDSQGIRIPPPNTYNVFVLPEDKILLISFVAYYPSTCQEITPGSWTQNNTPANGQPSYGLITGHLANGDCPGTEFTFAAVYYTWTSTSAGATTDTLSATWNGAGFTEPETFNFSLASVAVTNTGKVPSGMVVVDIRGPASAKGNFTINFKGKTNAYSQTFANRAAGSQTLTLNLASINPDTYSSATGTWTVNSSTVTSPVYTLPNQWVYLRLIRFSQYNTPYESACSGGAQRMNIYNKSSCTNVIGTLDSNFVSQTEINGTGSSISFGLLKPLGATNAAQVCRGRLPRGANSSNTFVRVSSVTGSCNSTISGNDSVATYPNPTSSTALLRCGNLLNLVTPPNATFATRSVADLCPACSGGFNKTNGHIDSYTSDQACEAHSIKDLGNFYTSHME